MPVPDRPHQEESLTCAVVPERDAVRIRPAGALDIATAPILDAQLAELCATGFRRLVVDLRDLTFLDSTGLRLVLAWEARSRKDGFDVVFVPGSPAVQRVFEVTGTLEHLTFVAP